MLSILGTVAYCCVLLRTVAHCCVLVGISWYFWVLLGTAGSFGDCWVLFGSIV